MDQTIPSLEVRVDYREHALFPLLGDRMEYTRANLPVGDVCFYKDSALFFILERKTLADLAASIKDGRLRSQFSRIRGLFPEPTTQIACCYLIEGMPPLGATKIGGLPLKTLYSSLINKTFRDKCLVYRTRDIGETADCIVQLVRSWREGAFDLGKVSLALPPTRKETITEKSCYLAMLCQIPGISIIKARLIADHYPTMSQLVTNQDGLENLRSTPESRRLGKSAAISVNRYLGILEKSGSE